MEYRLPARPCDRHIQRAENGKRNETEKFSEFQGEGDLAALSGDKPLADLAQQFEVHPIQITTWKRQLSDRAVEVFDKAGAADPPVDVMAMCAKIGRLTLENDFSESALTKVGLLRAKR